MKPQEFKIYSEEDYLIVSNYLKNKIENNIYILLYGDLGAGKTSLSKKIISSLTGENNVTSPTFNIMQQYISSDYEVSHYDLYRLKHDEELQEIGVFEENHNINKTKISLIEWPEIVEQYLEKNKVIKVKIKIEKEYRFVEIYDCSK